MNQLNKQNDKGNRISATKFNVFFILLVFSLVSIVSNSIYAKGKTSGIEKSQQKGWEQVPEILKKIVSPKFPDKVFDITNYGAVPDGKTLCTESFNKAIEACNSAGGGEVLVPKGTFLTGAIHLKSNINFYISEGAVVKFSTNSKDYLPLVVTRYEGINCMNYSPLIYAYGQENIALTGKGVLDGQADNQHWWPWVGNKRFGWKDGMPSMRDKGNRPALAKMNDDKVPLKDRVFGEGHYLRPTFVEFYKCKNILIKDVTLKNAPFWFLHPLLSTNITIDGIHTNSNGPNTDGCDPESCSYVLIENCVFNDGDDCIAVKSGRNNDGREVNVPSTNFVIRNCKMKDGHGGVVVGSEITGGCWNVFAENCEMNSPSLERALRIKSNAKRGGVIKNIYMRNIKIGQVHEAIVKVNLHYDPREAEGYNYKPEVENIHVDSVVSNKSEYGLYLDGLTDSKIKDIFINNCKFNNVGKGNIINDAVDVKFDNVYINGKLQD
jgi:polygalacturonase